VLLLTDLLKNTPEDHEDFESLSKATGKIKEVAEYVNTAKRKIEQLQYGISIHHDLGIKDIPPARVFLTEDTLYAEPVAGVAEKDLPKLVYRVYTFNDVLIFAKYKGKERSSYKVYELAQSEITEGGEAGTDPLCLRITGSNHSYFVPSVEYKERFLKAFTAAKLDAQREAAALEQRRRSTLEHSQGGGGGGGGSGGSQTPPPQPAQSSS
jgi:hypothetical protein